MLDSGNPQFRVQICLSHKYMIPYSGNVLIETDRYFYFCWNNSLQYLNWCVFSAFVFQKSQLYANRCNWISIVGEAVCQNVFLFFLNKPKG